MSGATLTIISLVATQILALCSGLLIMFLSRRPRAVERESREASTFAEYRGVLESQRERLEAQVKSLEERTMAVTKELETTKQALLEQTVRTMTSDRDLSEANRELDRLRDKPPRGQS